MPWITSVGTLIADMSKTNTLAAKVIMAAMEKPVTIISRVDIVETKKKKADSSANSEKTGSNIPKGSQ